ncbi:MAG: trigger factor [Vulcanimicrobiaceae bacterium]
MPRRGSRVRISSSADPLANPPRSNTLATSTLTKLAPTEVELEIPISQEELGAAEERAFRKLARNAKVPGFRPGKIPRKIFEQQYGAGVINSQAMEDIVPDAYTRAVREHDLQPVERPQMELLPVEEGKPLRLKAKVAVRPEIALHNYRGVQVEVAPSAVTDDDVQRSLQSLARERATLVPVNRPAALGDFVVLDFEGKVDGVVFEGGKAEGQTTELADGRFIPGFATGIAGMKAGETRDVTATFPADYTKEDLAGKKAVFTVSVHEVKEVELPAMDDEFAKAVSTHQTMDDLTGDIRRRLEAMAQSKARKETGNAIVEKLMAAHEFDLPEVMVEHEIDSLLNDARAFAARMNLEWEAYLRGASKSEEQLKEEFRTEAVRRVKATLLIEAVAKAEGIVATPSDVQTEVGALAQQYGQPPDRVRQALGRNIGSLMDGIVRSKTVDWLIEHGDVGAATVSGRA